MFDVDQILKNTFVAEVETHRTLLSTNDRALRCARLRTQRLPLLVAAENQTAGRGRGSNRWWTGPGSLAFSLLLGPEQIGVGEPDRSALLSLATGIAVVDALAPLAPAATVGLHWPNDVMAGKRKLAGILTEVLPGGWHVVGIGVNTNNTAADAPADLQPWVGTLRDLTGRNHDPTAVLIAILQNFQQGLVRLAEAPREITARADALCLQRGRVLTVRQGEHSIEGLCMGIAATGALRLRTQEGERLVYSGTVVKPAGGDSDNTAGR